MIWRKKPQPEHAPPPPPLVRNPEQTLAEALRAYQDHFYSSVRGSASDQALEARKVVDRARQIVGESGLGPALAPTLLEHVMYWPAWAKRSDFTTHIRFPCRYISGVIDDNSAERTKSAIVSFAYKDTLYTVHFVDNGLSAFGGDEASSGTVHLYRNAEDVFGLDISYDMSKGDAAKWRWSDVLSFQAGPWMQDLIEIAAYIEGNLWRSLNDEFDARTIARANKIKLPDKS